MSEAVQLTQEQQAAQQKQMEAMKQQQMQLQQHIANEVQKGVMSYNLDVQRLLQGAQALEACDRHGVVSLNMVAAIANSITSKLHSMFVTQNTNSDTEEDAKA